MRRNVEKVKRTRVLTQNRLRKMGFEVPPSSSNFVLARLAGCAAVERSGCQPVSVGRASRHISVGGAGHRVSIRRSGCSGCASRLVSTCSPGGAGRAGRAIRRRLLARRRSSALSGLVKAAIPYGAGFTFTSVNT